MAHEVPATTPVIESSKATAAATSSGARVRQIACSNFHTMLVTTAGELLVVGRNQYGELGLGTGKHASQLQHVEIPGVKQVATSPYHTVLVTIDGDVYTCGNNDWSELGLQNERYSQLNLANNSAQDAFCKPPLPKNVRAAQVACSAYHTIVVTTDGDVFACGCNKYGELGLGHMSPISTFEKVQLPHGVLAAGAACSEYHMAICTTEGGLLTCGYNGYGELGLGNNMSVATPAEVELPSDVKVASVSCSMHHTLVLSADGRLFGCGYNASGELGLPTTFQYKLAPLPPLPGGTKAIHVASTPKVTLILDNAGRLFSCGAASSCGLGRTKTRWAELYAALAGEHASIEEVVLPEGLLVAQAALSSKHALVLSASGELLVCGSNWYGEAEAQPDPKDVAQCITYTLPGMQSDYETQLKPLKAAATTIARGTRGACEAA